MKGHSRNNLIYSYLYGHTPTQISLTSSHGAQDPWQENGRKSEIVKKVQKLHNKVFTVLILEWKTVKHFRIVIYIPWPIKTEADFLIWNSEGVNLEIQKSKKRILNLYIQYSVIFCYDRDCTVRYGIIWITYSGGYNIIQKVWNRKAISSASRSHY